MSNRSAFTIIELLITITILGMLVGLAIVGSNFLKEEMKRTKAQADLLIIKVAAEKYLLEHGKFPAITGPVNSNCEINNTFLVTEKYIGRQTNPYASINIYGIESYVFRSFGRKYICFALKTYRQGGIGCQLYDDSNPMDLFLYQDGRPHPSNAGNYSDEFMGITNCTKLWYTFSDCKRCCWAPSNEGTDKSEWY